MIELDSAELVNELLASMIATAKPFMPYIAAVIVGEILYCIIKKFSHRVYDFIFFPISSREKKAAHKKIDKTIDAVSNAIDLISMTKSDNDRKK